MEKSRLLELLRTALVGWAEDKDRDLLDIAEEVEISTEEYEELLGIEHVEENKSNYRCGGIKKK